MLTSRKLALLLATAVFVTACGGGGDETPPVTNPGTTAPDDTPPETGGPNPQPNEPNEPNQPDEPNEPNEPDEPNEPAPIPAVDQPLNGSLHMSANQLVFIPGDRQQMYGFSYNGSPIEYFEQTGLEIASGGSPEDMNAEIPPSAIAPAAPIANFGFRVLNEVQRDAGGVLPGVQTVIGRVGLDFIERPDSPGIQSGEGAERVTFIIDNIELSTDANGRLISARALPNAQTYVAAVTATGDPLQATLVAPQDSVRLMPLYNVADHYGDTTAQVLMVDPEQAFSQAGESLAALHALRGEFDMHVTFSSIALVRPSKPETDEPALERRELAGQPIRLANHTPVNGGGVSGKVWIRRYVAQP